jgi:YihY family inner membrane protein
MIAAVRRHTVLTVARDVALRFRYSDGFSHARALALLLCLAVVPCLIALTGLADEAGLDEGGRFLAYLTLEVTPGRSDELVGRLLLHETHDDTGELASVVGLATGVVAVISAMGQIQRGANRIYGIDRDRPAVRKYARAALLAVGAGIPTVTGFLLIVAGRAVGDSLQKAYGWNSPAGTAWTVVHLPLAATLTVGGITMMFRYVPRRRQPPLRWLMPGVLVSVLAWIGLSLLLAGYVNSGLAFSAVYGPMTAVMALMLWANASAVALFLGFALCAQLEAYRHDVDGPVTRSACSGTVHIKVGKEEYHEQESLSTGRRIRCRIDGSDAGGM